MASICRHFINLDLTNMETCLIHVYKMATFYLGTNEIPTAEQSTFARGLYIIRIVLLRWRNSQV